MTRTSRHTEETRQRVYQTRERDERIAAAEKSAARAGMTLMERLEWYGADLETAMAWNDSNLFWTAVRNCRPQ